MSSTVGSPVSRVIRIYLVKNSGGEIRNLPVELPRELDGAVTELRQRPNRERAYGLANILAVQRWHEPNEVSWLAGKSPETAAGLALHMVAPPNTDPSQLRELGVGG